MSQAFAVDGSIVIGPQALDTMPQTLRQSLFAHLFPGLALVLVADEEEPQDVEEPEEEEALGPLADFTDQELSFFVGGCSAKTRRVLGIVARNREFNLNDVASEMGIDTGRLGGVWSGLTRRTRNVKNDPHVRFVHWDWSEATESYLGSFSPVTYDALRKLFAAG